MLVCSYRAATAVPESDAEERRVSRSCFSFLVSCLHNSYRMGADEKEREQKRKKRVRSKRVREKEEGE